MNSIDNVKRRLDQLENNLSPSKTYSEALKSVDKKISHIRADNSKAEILKEAKKIVGIAPITDDDIDYLLSIGNSRDTILMTATTDSLKYTIKMSDSEIQDLQITKVSRPRTPNTDRIYLHCASEKCAQYIYRKCKSGK